MRRIGIVNAVAMLIPDGLRTLVVSRDFLEGLLPLRNRIAAVIVLHENSQLIYPSTNTRGS